MSYRKNVPFVKVGLTGEVDSRFDNVNAQLAENDQQIEEVTKNPYNYNGAIVTIIDDDAKPDFRTVWEPVLTDTGEKISIAVITGRVGTADSLTLQELKDLQSQGHEIVSHTVNHETTDTVPVANAETDYPSAQQWLKENGFTGYETLVYPGGMPTNRIDLKDIARKYYKYGVATNHVPDMYNLPPVDSWRVPRIQGDTSTLEQLKSAVDDAILNNGWVILMTHSHVLLSAGSQKMRDFIAYVQSKSVPIMTFGEAAKYKGNTVAIGEYTEDTSTFVGANGSIKTGGSLIVRGTQDGLIDAPITSYKRNAETVQILNSVADTFLNTGGVYKVFRGVSDLYAFATFIPYNSSQMYTRKWDYYNEIWKVWSIAGSETGFWTPKLEGTTTPGTHTYTKQYGSYTKWANMVTVRFNVNITSANLDSAMAGNLQITGLPFMSVNTDAVARGVVDYNILNLGTNFSDVMSGINANQNIITLYKKGNGVSTNFLDKSTIPAGQTVIFRGEITYQAE